MNYFSEKLKTALIFAVWTAVFAVQPLAAQWQPLRKSFSHPQTPAISRPQYGGINSFNKLPPSKSISSFSKPQIPVKETQRGLSPEVLETIRNLKKNKTEERKQMTTPSPVTGLSSENLINPNSNFYNQNMETSSFEVKSSYLTLPPEKNVMLTSLDFRRTNVTDALTSLATIVNINLMLSPNIQGEVSVLFNNVSMEEAFNTILTNYGLAFSWSGSILRIFPESAAPTSIRIFPIQHTNAADIQPIIQRILEGRGTCDIDARTNSLMVSATQAKLAEINNLLPKLDITESTVDITSRPVTEVFYLNYADATALAEPIRMLSSGASVLNFSSSQASQAGMAGGTGQGRMDMMIITDTQVNLDRIRELIEKLDSPPIQVTIDAHIYELDKNKEANLGINWQKAIPNRGGMPGNLFDINISPMGNDAGGTGVFRFGSLDMHQFSAVLSMLNTSTFAKVLSNPVITTLNNRPANITVGQAISYVSASQVNAETGQVTNTIEQANANIVLDVTPSVTGNDEVFLDIRPTISSVLGYTTLGGNSTPNLSNRSAQTQVICKNNHTIVIGGMIKTDKNVSVNKVPILGDLPGIGRLFRSKNTKEVQTELIIFITPHIVRGTANTQQRSYQSSSNALRSRLLE